MKCIECFEEVLESKAKYYEEENQTEAVCDKCLVQDKEVANAKNRLEHS